MIETTPDFSTDWTQFDVESKACELLRSWDFDVWAYKEEQLFPFFADMFNDFGLFEKFNVPREKFQNFLNEAKNNYSKKNPYHNFRHAFDVRKMIKKMIKEEMDATKIASWQFSLHPSLILSSSTIYDL